MNHKHHQGSVRSSCWHATNPRILISGGDDLSIRIWRLYPPSESFHDQLQSQLSRPHSKLQNQISTERTSPRSHYHSSDGSLDNQLFTNFNPAIHPLFQLLSMQASGEVKGLCMPSRNGELLAVISSRLFNAKSSLDIFHLPHWIWNYASKTRLTHRLQFSKFMKKNSISSVKQMQKYGITFESDDFCQPLIIPLPYGARERCITFSPSPSIVFVGLLSCRKKHQRTYCCLMACNVLNGASRPCYKINSLLYRKECIYSIALSSPNVHSRYQLAIGTNLGRLIIVTLKSNLDWQNTRRSFITGFSVAAEMNANQLHDDKQGNDSSDLDVVRPFTRVRTKSKTRSSKYSVLTARERTFREMVDTTTVSITMDSLYKYLKKQNAAIEKEDITEFYKFLRPNKKGEITFSQYVQKIDTDGDAMRAFTTFCLTGSSRTDRRPWMTSSSEDEDDMDTEDMYPHSNGKHKFEESEPVTSIQWSTNNEYIFTGHMNGEIKFWSKHHSITEHESEQKRDPEQEQKCDRTNVDQLFTKSKVHFQKRGALKHHSESVTSLSLSGTYLVSSSIDGDILVWHLDFLVRNTENAPITDETQTTGIVQLLAAIESAHLGEEVCDVKLSNLSSSVQHCIPNAMYLLSSGADEHVRCRDVMEVLRQQLSHRILADAQQQVPKAFSESGSKLNRNLDNNAQNEDSDSDVGLPEYTAAVVSMDFTEKVHKLTAQNKNK